MLLHRKRECGLDVSRMLRFVAPHQCRAQTFHHTTLTLRLRVCCVVLARVDPHQPAMVRAVDFGSTPRFGERILVLRREWLQQILDGRKTLEIRGARLREGDVWLGSRCAVFGKARLGSAVPICTEQEWAALRPQHLVAGAALPYKTTWGLPLQSVMRLRDDVPFLHHRGAIGIVKFEPP